MRYQYPKNLQAIPTIFILMILAITMMMILSCGGDPPTQSVTNPPSAVESADVSTADLSFTDDQLLIGLWEGSLQIPTGKLVIQFTIAPAAGSDPKALEAQISVPQQQVLNVQATLEITSTGLTITIDPFKASFTAPALTRPTPDGPETLSGTWKQSGQSFPLELTRVSKEIPMAEDIAPAGSTFARPQNIEPPFPYIVEQISFNSQFDGIKLAGTVTRPDPETMPSASTAKSLKVPAVVLVTGSGLQNRDEEIFGHRPFALIADRLTRAGFAVLRYDDRGFAESEGDASSATTRELLKDAESAVNWLRSQEWCDPDKVGIAGHSEGGLIAMMAAADPVNRLGFIVSLAGPGVPGTQVIISQSEAIMRAQGYPESMVETAKRANESIYKIILSKLPLADRKAATVKELIKAGVPKEGAEAQVAALFSPWFMTFLSLDPREYLSMIHDIPVLALNGSLDLQVIPSINLTEIEKTLQAAGNTQVTAMTLPGLNHLFQPAQTGLVDEYALIETTFSEDALMILTDWLRSVNGQ